jgi:hypothetical protein
MTDEGKRRRNVENLLEFDPHGFAYPGVTGRPHAHPSEIDISDAGVTRRPLTDGDLDRQRELNSLAGSALDPGLLRFLSTGFE